MERRCDFFFSNESVCKVKNSLCLRLKINVKHVCDGTTDHKPMTWFHKHSNEKHHLSCLHTAQCTKPKPDKCPAANMAERVSRVHATTGGNKGQRAASSSGSLSMLFPRRPGRCHSSPSLISSNQNCPTLHLHLRHHHPSNRFLTLPAAAPSWQLGPPALTSVEISWNVTLAWVIGWRRGVMLHMQTHSSLPDQCAQSPHDCCHRHSAVARPNRSGHACFCPFFSFSPNPSVPCLLQPSPTWSSVCHGDLAWGPNEKAIGQRGYVNSAESGTAFNVRL